MKLRTLVSVCAPVLLLAGCDRLNQESKKKPEAPAVTEQPAASPQTTAAPAEMQTTAPEAVVEALAEPAQEPLRVGGKVTRPELIHKVPLDFGALNSAKVRMAGVFIAEAVIDAKGNVSRVRILKGFGPKFDPAALASLRQWKFKPATLDGKPVAVYYTLTTNIHLQ